MLRQITSLILVVLSTDQFLPDDLSKVEDLQIHQLKFDTNKANKQLAFSQDLQTVKMNWAQFSFWSSVYGTESYSTGKHFWQFQIKSASWQWENQLIGISDGSASWTASEYPGLRNQGVCQQNWNGQVLQQENEQQMKKYGERWTQGDVIGMQLDLDSKKLSFYKNGVNQGLAVDSQLNKNIYYPVITLYGYTSEIVSVPTTRKDLKVKI